MASGPGRSWRRTRAIELRAAGLSYDQIALEVGYANRGTAHNVVATGTGRPTGPQR